MEVLEPLWTFIFKSLYCFYAFCVGKVKQYASGLELEIFT